MDLDAAVIERWVQPLYMEVLSAKQPAVVTEQLAEACGAVTPAVVEALLADFNWRPRKMAAIYAGINGWSEFTDAISERLLKSEVVYAGEWYCFALARFGTDEAVAFLKQYLDVWLTRPECWYDQSHALAALLWLDQARGNGDATPYLSENGLWMRFVQNKPNWSLERTQQTFFDKMRFCQEKFPL